MEGEYFHQSECQGSGIENAADGHLERVGTKVTSGKKKKCLNGMKIQ